MTELEPRITDEEVRRLQLSHGRSELLEEIMRTEDTDPTLPLTARTRSGWWAAAAAAAVVAGIAVVPALRGDDRWPRVRRRCGRDKSRRARGSWSCWRILARADTDARAESRRRRPRTRWC